MRNTLITQLILASAACALTACGGGGGGSGLVSTPAPIPNPTPTPNPTATVTIFSAPTPGEYVSVGVASASSLVTATAKLTNVSSADAGGFYEIQMPGAAWDKLVHYKGLSNPTSANNYFQPSSVAQNLGYLIVSKSRDRGFNYSELASWGTDLVAAAPFGVVGFGIPTPAGAVPISGAATYSGEISGTTDILSVDYLYGGYFPAAIEGGVTLSFDFAAGTLAGSMSPIVNDGVTKTPLGTLTFAETVFSSGSPTYSGRFDTSAAGINYFLGRFTGPAAQETIGAWAFPFVYPADGQTHQAIGAWIAKRP